VSFLIFHVYIESASNDSLAYPFISIALYLTTEPNRGRDIRDWILIGWLCMSSFRSWMKVVTHELQDQVILGIVIGIIIGESWIFSSNGCSDV